jgi:hypothetical protein
MIALPLPADLPAAQSDRLREVFGYLDFSSGTHDPKFLRNLNELFAVAAAADAGKPGYSALGRLLTSGIAEVRRQGSLGELAQATAAVRTVFDEVLPAYLEFHRDLLFHQTAERLFSPLFIGRVFEVVLSEGGPWNEQARIQVGAIRRLNDYVGYRPVAQHADSRKGETYPHERVRPVPLYIADAGVDLGRYHEVMSLAFDILRGGNQELLRQAWFDLDLVEEVAYDPRAYDFDHPVHKRPNHHFGQWDLDLIDNRGYYRRFIVQQVTLDALSARIHEKTKSDRGQFISRDELLYEAAAVLAGTMLMGSGTSGNRPECHDSTVSLANLLPHIAAYRDAFYEDLIRRVGGAHRQRLQAEASRLKQPFGGARQHLNGRLSRLRAAQLEHVHVAQAYAAMGYYDAARREAAVVPVASARMICEMNCRLTACRHDADAGGAKTPERIAAAAALLAETEDLLHRGIECGALIDPWNITWFSAQFGLFRALEDSVYDHRVDQLIELLERLFVMYARLVSEAYSAGDDGGGKRMLGRMQRLAAWWDRYATTSTSSVDSFSGKDLHASAAHVGRALAAWHQGGAASGDVAFWREHVADFRSPRTFARVVEALLDKHDYVAAMALLVQWLSQAPDIALEEGDDSFHELVARWMSQLLAEDSPDVLRSARRLLDFLEANADEYWDPPALDSAGESGGRLFEKLFGPEDRSAQANPDGELGGPGAANPDAESDEGDEDGDDANSLFGAAYENVVFRDSAADGTEGELADSSFAGSATDDQFEQELKRITDRLAFLSTLAGLWKQVAIHAARDGAISADLAAAIAHWRDRCRENRNQLTALVSAVQRFRLAAPTGTFDSHVEYDRRRAMKETLLDRIIASAVESADALDMLSAVLAPVAAAKASDMVAVDAAPSDFAALAGAVDRALVAAELPAIHAVWDRLLSVLRGKTSLYLPLARGGDPLLIAEARVLHQRLRQWLAWLPRVGLLAETFELVDAIRAMEVEHPVGPGAVTEFDRLFETAFKSLVEAVVIASTDWDLARLSAASGAIDVSASTIDPAQLHRAQLDADATTEDGADLANNADRSETSDADAAGAAVDGMLGMLLQQVTEPFLVKWLAHSQTLRLSSLERVDSDEEWRQLRTLVEHYGHDLFTQQFMNLGNLRAILHQGVDAWFDRLADDPDGEPPRIVADLDGPLPRGQTIRNLTIILEAVVDNYAEYRDYNSTTTQSDRGELLYTFLDFLRLKASYERAHWNLRPVMMAHEVLVRHGRAEAAQLWRRALVERTADVADRMMRQLERLQKQYGMRLPAIADRVGERFVRPLDGDRVVALVRPAMDEARERRAPHYFEVLQSEVSELTAEPTGAGLDVPEWLAAVEDEVDIVTHGRATGAPADSAPVPRLKLTYESIAENAQRMTTD